MTYNIFEEEITLINRNIEELIADKNISAYEIEKATHVSSSTIINIRNGKRSTKNLSQETVIKLNYYYLKTHNPEQIFWNEKDKTALLSFINADPIKNWTVSIRKLRIMENTQKTAYIEYPIDIKVPAFDDKSKELMEQYWDKYDNLQNQIYADKKYPVPIQPFYTDYAQTSFINSEQMLEIIQRLRDYLNVSKTVYGDQLEQDNDVLHRTVTALPFGNTSDPVYSDCLLLSIEPLVHPMSLSVGEF